MKVDCPALPEKGTIVKIGWVTGKDEGWAYKNDARHYQKALKDFLHVDFEVSEDAPVDVLFLFSPAFAKGIKNTRKAVLHIDSFRALGL